MYRGLFAAFYPVLCRRSEITQCLSMTFRAVGDGSGFFYSPQTVPPSSHLTHVYGRLPHGAAQELYHYHRHPHDHHHHLQKTHKFKLCLVHSNKCPPFLKNLATLWWKSWLENKQNCEMFVILHFKATTYWRRAPKRKKKHTPVRKMCVISVC